VTLQLVALKLVDEGVPVDHTLDWLKKKIRVETLRMSALKSVRVILVY
jgi:hypothetical protein